MENSTQKIIEQRFRELPNDIQDTISNSNLAQKFLAIAEKYGLHVDQNGLLQNETMLVMLGLEPTKDYVENLVRELEVTKIQAQSIAEDVNKDIFGSIRESLQKIQPQEEGSATITTTASSQPFNQTATQPNLPTTPPPPTKPLSPLEKAGGFEIVNNKIASSSPQYNDNNLDKNKILQDVENPPAPTKVSFVDHLLAKPITTQNKVEEQTPKPKPPAPQETKMPSIDPYREPIE